MRLTDSGGFLPFSFFLLELYFKIPIFQVTYSLFHLLYCTTDAFYLALHFIYWIVLNFCLVLFLKNYFSLLKNSFCSCISFWIFFEFSYSLLSLFKTATLNFIRWITTSYAFELGHWKIIDIFWAVIYFLDFSCSCSFVLALCIWSSRYLLKSYWFLSTWSPIHWYWYSWGFLSCCWADLLHFSCSFLW